MENWKCVSPVSALFASLNRISKRQLMHIQYSTPIPFGDGRGHCDPGCPYLNDLIQRPYDMLAFCDQAGVYLEWYDYYLSVCDTEENL